ncbi:MAG: NADH-quinone oxidoreductase subunit NuoK [Pseudomonadota bacterium]|nr:NADH-quinone oxidoreductase subunit NuoK [Pseudomonadota bacterium]
MTPLDYMLLSVCLFGFGLIGLVLNQKNTLALLMAIELMLLASSLNFVAFSSFYEHLDGQIMALFIVALAACETAVGLALFILMYRRYHSVDTDRLQSLRG